VLGLPGTGSAHMRGGWQVGGWQIAGAGLLAVLGGCASWQDMAGIPRSGHQQDGTYIVSADEENLACRQIRERIDILSNQLQILPQRAAIEQKSQPSTMTAALGRWFGGEGDGLQATEDYQRAAAESDALKALLIKKQCS
jgi:hypothetical protein